jgi:hypothetical protein
LQNLLNVFVARIDFGSHMLTRHDNQDRYG